MINLSSLRLNDSTQLLDTSSIRIGLKFVLLDLGSDFSENLLFLAFKENPDSSVFHFATLFSFLVLTKFAYGSLRTSVCEKRTELATNFLHESDKLVSGSLVLVAPE